MTEQARIRIRHIHSRAVSLVWCMGLPLYAVLLLLSPWLLHVWLGHSVAVDLPGAFRIALVSSFASLACVPAYFVLLGLGYVRHCVMCQALLAAGNVLLVLGLTWVDRGLSVSEVLLSTLIATIVSSTYVVIQNSRVLRRQPASMGSVEKNEGFQVVAAQCM